ncbi:hypothetical protein MTO96_013015 [Rhipicephalus appendiculatus]
MFRCSLLALLDNESAVETGGGVQASRGNSQRRWQRESPGNRGTPPIDIWALTLGPGRLRACPVYRFHEFAPVSSLFAPRSPCGRHRALSTAEEYQRVTGKADATKDKGQRRSESMHDGFLSAHLLLSSSGD